MSRSLFAGAACALWLAASPVVAEPFETFVDMCMDTGLDRQGTDAKAKSTGWVPIPTEGADFGEDLQDPSVYSSVDPATVGDKGPPEGFELLMTGWAPGSAVFDIGGVRLDLCMVLSPSSDAAGMQARLQEFLNVPVTEMEGAPAWIFSRAGSTFRSELSIIDLTDEEALRLASQRKVYIAAILPQEGMYALMLAAIRPDE